jgi:hypothetical protein
MDNIPPGAISFISMVGAGLEIEISIISRVRSNSPDTRTHFL